MPTLIVDDIPIEIYERLQRSAHAFHRRVQDEAINLLQQGLRQEETVPVPRLPDLIPTEEISPPL